MLCSGQKEKMCLWWCDTEQRHVYQTWMKQNSEVNLFSFLIPLSFPLFLFLGGFSTYLSNYLLQYLFQMIVNK